MPQGFESILAHALPFAVVVTRLTGLFMIAPLLSSAMIPRRVKALSCLALAAVLYPTLPAVDTAAFGSGVDLFTLGPMLAGELVVGLSIGVVALLPLMAMQIAGMLIGQQLGLGIASLYNPAIDIEGDSVGQMLFTIALAAFLALGGAEVMFLSLADSLRAVPPLCFAPHEAPLGLVAGVLDAGLDLALRVSMPVLTVVYLETVAFGFLNRSVPALHVMVVSFPIRILLGFGMLVASFGLIHAAARDEIAQVLVAIEDWIALL